MKDLLGPLNGHGVLEHARKGPYNAPPSGLLCPPNLPIAGYFSASYTGAIRASVIGV